MKGFTLIELMVVIGITVLLSGSGIAAYNRFNSRQLVRREGAAATDLLRLAQTKALTGDKPAGGACEGANLDGYRVRWSTDRFVLEAVCGGAAVEVKVNPPAAGEVELIAGTQVSFKVLAQGAVGDSFCWQGYGWLYRVRVLGSGEVVEDGFVESC